MKRAGSRVVIRTMKRSLLIACAIIVVAGPVYAEESPIAPWLGTWKGKVSSKGCADPVNGKVELEVAETPEHGLRSNGDLLIEGLGDLDWIGAGKRLTLAREGLRGSLKMSKKTASLKLHTDAGCTVTATLKRTKKGAPAAPSTTGLSECDDYITLIDRYMRCDKVPQQARDAARQGIEAAKTGWGQLGQMPLEARKAAADACHQANDALRQGAAAMGCPL